MNKIKYVKREKFIENFFKLNFTCSQQLLCLYTSSAESLLLEVDELHGSPKSSLKYLRNSETVLQFCEVLNLMSQCKEYYSNDDRQLRLSIPCYNHLSIYSYNPMSAKK